MKLFKNNHDVWINLSLCHRIYWEKNGPEWVITAARDIGEREVVEYTLWDGLTSQEMAEKTLNQIMGPYDVE